ADGAAATDMTVSALISGTGGLTKTGAGTMALTGNNTFSGVLSVQTGTLSVGTVNNANANGPLGNSANAVVMGGSTGTLQYTGGTATSDKAFTLASGGTGVFQIDSAGTTLTLNGNIDGSGTLQKTGAGTLTLGNANTYTGGTTLSGGTLKMGANNAFGT